jgi:hypothetical protein
MMQTRLLDDYLVPRQQCVSCGYGIRMLSTGRRVISSFAGRRPSAAKHARPMPLGAPVIAARPLGAVCHKNLTVV